MCYTGKPGSATERSFFVSQCWRMIALRMVVERAILARYCATSVFSGNDIGGLKCPWADSISWPAGSVYNRVRVRTLCFPYTLMF